MKKLIALMQNDKIHVANITVITLLSFFVAYKMFTTVSDYANTNVLGTITSPTPTSTPAPKKAATPTTKQSTPTPTIQVSINPTLTPIPSPTRTPTAQPSISPSGAPRITTAPTQTITPQSQQTKEDDEAPLFALNAPPSNTPIQDSRVCFTVYDYKDDISSPSDISFRFKLNEQETGWTQSPEQCYENLPNGLYLTRVSVKDKYGNFATNDRTFIVLR